MEKQLIPQLRFPEFEDEWGKMSFTDIVKVNQGLAILKSNRHLEDGENRLPYITIPYLEGKKAEFIENPKKSVICKKEDIIITRTGSGLGQVWTNNYGVFHNNFFKVEPIDLKEEDKRFIYYYLLTSSIQNKMWMSAGVGAIPDLNHSDFYALPYFKASISEQQKVASFLTDVDDKITKLIKKKDFLVQYKKGILQKTFSQELRFKDDNGNEFLKWKMKKLGELLDYEQPTKYIVESTEYDDSFKTPVLTAGKSFLLGYTNETEGVYNKLPTIIFDDFTMANKYVDFEFKVKSSAMKILQPKTDEVNIKFVYEAIQMIKYPKGDEHKRFWISEYSKIKIGYPCVKEQTKIANFLSDIDLKIEALNTKIEHSKSFKKGLLQQMFV